MTVADDLERARAALQMINPAPYNAEAPPEALAGEITPTELHYVRSNFARARRTTAPSRSAAPSSNPTTLTLDDLRAHAGASSARSRSNAPATGASRCGRCRPASPGATTPSRPPAGPAPSCTTCSTQAQPGSRRRRRPVRGRRPRRRTTSSRSSPETDQDDLTFVRALPLAHAADPGGGDPDRLRDERRAAAARPRRPVPAHRAALVRRRLREVAEADRRPHRAVRRRVPDRPLHLRVARPTARARHPDARARPHHRPRARRDHRRRHATPSAARPGRAPGPITARRRQPHRRREAPAMAVADELASSPRRAGDDQPRARTTPRLRRRPSSATSPPPSSTTSAATSRCPTHDGTLEIGGAVGSPTTLTLDDLRAHAGPSTTPSRSSAPATAAWRCGRCRPASPGATSPSPPPAGPAPCCTRSWRRRGPRADGVEVRFEGADHGAYHLRRSCPRPTRTT